METRDIPVTAYLEPTFYKAMCAMIDNRRPKIALAAYVRTLIIKDLRDQDVITSEVFETVMT